MGLTVESGLSDCPCSKAAAKSSSSYVRSPTSVPRATFRPVRYYSIDFGHDGLGLFFIQCEVRRAGQQHMRIVDRSVFLRQPGFGFPPLVWKRVDVEGWRKTPQYVRYMLERW